MTQCTERIIRLLRPSIVVLCGPSGCGKSHFAARHFRPSQVISSDQCRALICDDERDQRYPSQTFALVNFIINQRLSINRLCVLDSTALTPASRRSMLEIARRHRVRSELFLFDVPMERCIERDRLRQRSVGPKVIQEQFQILAQLREGLASEGFDQITDFREEDLDSISVEVIYRPVNSGKPDHKQKSRHPVPSCVGSNPHS